MYHYGMSVKEYRLKKNMTQAELAEVWPKSNGDRGVSVDYVSMIEHGRRGIADHKTLRILCEILDIPLWEVGLSEYDPFQINKLPGNGKYMYSETLDAIEGLIENAWVLRQTASFPTVNKNIERLENLFRYMNVYVSKKSRQDIRYNKLYAQVLRLQGMVYVEEKDEIRANHAFNTMYKIAKEIDDPVTLALACMGIGTDYSRKNNHKEAIRYLEASRDYTFETSKQLSGLVTAFLARSYAKDKDEYHFEQAIDTAYRIARHLGNEYGNGVDFCIHTISDILEEKSNGYIELSEGKKTLALKEEIERQITQDNNNYLYAWIPLDYAQAYMNMGEVERSIASLRDFYDRMRKQLQSPLALSKVKMHIRQMHNKGYGDVQVVKEFHEQFNLDRV